MEANKQRIGNDGNMTQITNNIYTNMTELMRSINKVLATVKVWQEVSWQRRELINLSDHQLKDIGISRADAQHEADRHFWDIGPVRDRSFRGRQNSYLKQCCNKATELCST